MNTALEDEKLQLEIEKLQLENEKLKLERDQLTSEKSPLKRWMIPLATPVSILVTIVIAWISWNNNLVLQNRQAQDGFELKVAEFILNADTTSLAANRSRALLHLFPGRFSPAFAEILASFRPKDYTTGLSPEYLLQERRMAFDGRLELLKVISAHEDAQPILDRWTALFEEYDRTLLTGLPAAPREGIDIVFSTDITEFSMPSLFWSDDFPMPEFSSP